MWQTKKTENCLWSTLFVSMRPKVLALVMAIVVAAPALAIAYQDDGDVSIPSAEVQAQIDEQIRQLGSSSFVDRQIAVEQLWQFGHQASASLKRASESSDPEVSRRATEILNVLSMGIDSKTNPELAKLILRFQGSERSVQVQILKDLLKERKLPLAFELLEKISSETDQRYLYNTAVPIVNTVINLGNAGRWEDLELILKHPMTFKFQTTFVVQYQMARKELEPLITRLKDKIEKVESAQGKKAKLELPKLLNRMIAILVMERRFDEAEKYIAKVKKEPLRLKLLNQMLFEKGDWNAIFKKLALEDEVLNVGDGKIKVSESQRAMVAKFVGDEEAYQSVVAAMREKVKDAKKDKDETAEKKWRDALAEIGFVNLDWKLAEENWNLKEGNSFELLVDYRKTEKAFELIGLGDTVEERDLWFKRKMRHVNTLREKVKRFNENQKDADEVSTKLEMEWEICGAVVDLLAGLGHTDEAVTHCYTMFANCEAEEFVQYRSALVWQLIWMNRFDEARNLVDKGFRPSEHKGLLPNLFPSQKDVAASYWYRILAPRYPNSLERLKATAGIVNSPFCDIPNFDLDYELANVQPEMVYQKSGYWDFQLGLVYEFHGREREYDLHMEVSRQLGYVGAKQRLVKKAVDDGDHDVVIDYYDSVPYNRTAFGALMSADAYLQKGDIEKSALRRALAFAYWNNRYRSSGTMTQLTNVNKQKLAADFLKLQLYQMDDIGESSITNERYRKQLGDAQQETEPKRALVNNRIFLFNHAATDEPGEQAGTYWFDHVVETEKSRARTLIREGKFKDAADILIKCDSFAPGDPGIGEKLIAEMDDAGGSAEAQRVYKQMSGFYYDVLEKHPDSPLNHNNFAWLCACARQNREHMLRHAELAVSLRPNTPSYLDTLALVYFLKGDLDNAIKFSRKCLAIYPSKQNYREQLMRYLKAKTKVRKED